MTEKRKGRKEAGPEKSISRDEVLKFSLNALNELITGAHELSFLDIMHKAFSSLQAYLENDVTSNAWRQPVLELQYDAPPDEVTLSSDIQLTKQGALQLAKEVFDKYPYIVEKALLHALTHRVAIRSKGNWREDGELVISDDMRAELDALAEEEKNARLEKLALGYRDINGVLKLTDTAKTIDGQDQAFDMSVIFIILPQLIFPDRAYFPILAGFDFAKGDPSTWTDDSRHKLWKALFDALDKLAARFGVEKKRTAIRKPDRILPARPDSFNVPGNLVRPIYATQDAGTLLEFHEYQTPLTWALGHTLFSLTSEDRVRAGDWQEASVHDIEDIVFQLTERGATRHGQNREDLLAEIVKLCTTPNWYFEIGTQKFGLIYRKIARIGAVIPIPEIEFIFWDNEKKRLASPADPSLSKYRTELEVKGRRVIKQDGKLIPALDPKRFTWAAFRWRWVQSFNDDLICAPALIEDGRKAGLPKKTASGKVIRKGYPIRVSKRLISALRILRTEGRGNLYATRLLIMLAHDLHKTEDGITADRVFSRLGFIPRQDGRGYKTTTHESPESLVARAVWRLKQPDIGALKPGSDEMPRTDPNPDRRKGAYYRFYRTPDFMPLKGIVTKEEAEEIEREYAPPQLSAAQDAQSADLQATLPGLEGPTIPRPAGTDIRAARTAAGLDLRTFARTIAKGLSHTAWARIERGEVSETALARIPADIWQRVQAFIDQRKKPESRHDGKAE